jgi:hypothetical protein
MTHQKYRHGSPKNWGIKDEFSTPNAPEHRFANIDKGNVIIYETPETIYWATLNRKVPAYKRAASDPDLAREQILACRIRTLRRVLLRNSRVICDLYGNIGRVRKLASEEDAAALSVLEERSALWNTIRTLERELEAAEASP